MTIKTNLETIDQLFMMLNVAYSNPFKADNLSETKKVWHLHLKDFDADLIQQAALTMIDTHPKFAPTIGEFKEMIRELNKAKPKLYLEMQDICSNCRGHRKSAIHQSQCLGGNDHVN